MHSFSFVHQNITFRFRHVCDRYSLLETTDGSIIPPGYQLFGLSDGLPSKRIQGKQYCLSWFESYVLLFEEKEQVAKFQAEHWHRVTTTTTSKTTTTTTAGGGVGDGVLNTNCIPPYSIDVPSFHLAPFEKLVVEVHPSDPNPLDKLHQQDDT